jgi:CBS domain containing-hemolysin-like protein
VISIEADDCAEKAIILMRNHGHTRLPVYDNLKDNVIGFIHAKDLMLTETKTNIRKIIRPALYIYDHLTINAILEMMKEKKSKLGLVWDEYGSWQGLLTMEDVIESIVGEIQDEFDREEPIIELKDKGTALCQTTVSLDELSQYLPLELGPDSEERYRTLAALLADKFGENPVSGLSWKGYGATFTVATTDGLVVTKILVSTPDND